MPPSPALRCSPAREQRASNHKRGHSFEGGLLFREKDEDLALFNEMQYREKEDFLVQSSDDLEVTFSCKLKHFSDFKLGISIPARGESSDLLNADDEKNDYEWLLTPPDTPLFPSLDDEPPQVCTARRGRPRSQPISISRSSTMEKSYRSSRGSASPNRLSPSPRSGNSSFQSRGRPSSARQSSPSPSLGHATPSGRPSTPPSTSRRPSTPPSTSRRPSTPPSTSRRPSTPPSKPSTPVPRSSTPTPRRMSTGSGGSVASSGIRGNSPVKTSRGNSASPKIRAWQTNIPGFSSDAPPNLRTSLADRPASYVRGSSPANRNGMDSSSIVRRQSMSPTASRSVSSSHSHDRDPFSSHSKGSVASSGDDDVDSLQSIHVGSLDRSTSRRVSAFSNNRAPAFSKKSLRMVSPSSAPKKSFDSALRQMDHRKSPNMFRPLLSSVPSTTFYAGKASSVQRSLISRNSSVTTSSNASSDQGTSAALDAEGSDHNQDDANGEFEKVPYSDVQEEVFAFDKMDVVNEAIGHDIYDGSCNINEGDFDRSVKIECGPANPSEAHHHDNVMEVGATCEVSLVNNDLSQVDSLESMVVCSRCGCRYHATDHEESDVKLCPECNRKDNLLMGTPAETAIVSETSSELPVNNLEEEKPFNSFTSVIAVPELPRATDVSKPKSSHNEENKVEDKTFYNERSHNHLQENSPGNSELEGVEDRLAKQQEIAELAVGHSPTNSDAGNQKLRNSTDYPNLKVDLEGAGISVLLKRTSSSKGPVFQGRTFAASSMAYDDLSYAKDSASSVRSTIGHSSFSASSSVDFTSAKQTDTRVQRQLSGKKSDMETHKYGISNHAHQAPSCSTSAHEDGYQNMTYDVAQFSDCMEVGPTNTSIIGTSVVEEDDYAHKNNNGTVDESTSEDKFVASLPNYEDNVSNDIELPKDASLGTDVETLATTPKPYAEEVLNFDGVDSEIETENHHKTTPGSLSDDLSLASKSSAEEFLEPSASTPSDADITASASEPKTTDQACEILEQESMIMVECQRGSRTRSLTLEEATDTILFCSSIVHDLAYEAAAIAMEKEASAALQSSWPTVTILGTSNSDNKDPPRGRTAGKKSSKSQKARQRRVETDTKTPSSMMTENDENNAVESLKRNVGPPNKVDTMKPPKLESKCNCTIM
ncbi:hypothetical protein UlMin_039904 [Ulmus minor]